MENRELRLFLVVCRMANDGNNDNEHKNRHSQAEKHAFHGEQRIRPKDVYLKQRACCVTV